MARVKLVLRRADFASEDDLITFTKFASECTTWVDAIFYRWLKDVGLTATHISLTHHRYDASAECYAQMVRYQRDLEGKYLPGTVVRIFMDFVLREANNVIIDIAVTPCEARCEPQLRERVKEFFEKCNGVTAHLLNS